MKENSFNLDPEKVNHVFHAKNIYYNFKNYDRYKIFKLVLAVMYKAIIDYFIYEIGNAIDDDDG